MEYIFHIDTGKHGGYGRYCVTLYQRNPYGDCRELGAVTGNNLTTLEKILRENAKLQGVHISEMRG